MPSEISILSNSSIYTSYKHSSKKSSLKTDITTIVKL